MGGENGDSVLIVVTVVIDIGGEGGGLF